MKVLIMSDIHGNRTALEAVLEAAGKVDAVWCWGILLVMVRIQTIVSQ